MLNNALTTDELTFLDKVIKEAETKVKRDQYLLYSSDEYSGAGWILMAFDSLIEAQLAFRAYSEAADLLQDYVRVVLIGAHQRGSRSILAFRREFAIFEADKALTPKEKAKLVEMPKFYIHDGAVKEEYGFFDKIVAEFQ